ncbi:contact-dependent growth inhibition system immunity protein [Saccharopolyspora sp. K220]|uniref:contact-dependent growth inhibition system immunity protein n=1 Tax=Saccharopolyspora soli TaxID=2926618 RepID=UPI001F5ADCC2|nr:contact-dependent growth inhibition system immunity protein [Saccharopolyspora soli]MCI2424032.1 contact-dependent growth inhibition system immunity protein [Saccharopolyspora soli]
MANEDSRGDLSLEQVEDDVWGEPPADATTLVRTVHQLRRKPLGALSAADLRVLVAQKVGVDVLMPRVLTLLERDPLVEGDFYPGDVLVAVLQVPAAYWSANPGQRARIENIIASIDHPDSQLKTDIDTFRAHNQ